MVRSSFSLFSIADKYRLATIFFALLLLSACGFGGPLSDGDGQEDARVQRVDTAMGTVVQITLYPAESGKRDQAEAYGEEILSQVKRLEKEMLSYREEGSEVFAVNARAGVNEKTPVSPGLLELLATCEEISESSGGAFDITVGSLSRLWNMDEVAAGKAKARIPTEGEIAGAKACCGFDKLHLEKDGLYLEKGVSIDLGSVGKGYALDVIAQRLHSDEGNELSGGVIALGGSILTFGEKRGGAFRIGIRDPEEETGIIGYLTLTGEWYVSTSGDYERYFEADGMRLHHILDPATGYPADSGLRSVTVVADSGLLSDALSTACFVAGEEEGKRLAREYGAMLLLVRDTGEIWCSEELRQYFHQGN